MSRYLPLVLASAVGVLFSACETTKPDPEEGGRFGHGRRNNTDVSPGADNAGPEATPKPKVDVSSNDGDNTPSVEVEATPTPMPTPAAVVDYPTAETVPGKHGFVKSLGGSGIVDVRGYPPGTEVKDPYSGKVFLVP